MQRPVPPLAAELADRARRDGVTTIDESLGRLLSMLVHCMQANRIVEVGTGYGYATLWMSLALPPAGKIWTIDPAIDRTRVAQEYLGRAQTAQRVEIVNSPALDVLSHFPLRNLDIVFVDASHEEYAAYLKDTMPLIKLSGLLIFHGLGHPAAKVPRELEPFMREFLNRDDIDATVVPVGDGTGIGARIR
ncbi:MAG: class I SAM-dependent methyltransferase [Candidatus Eremiobacteraeota bacterium]|nr:class I SAM-dependent methyltransferase [Candidatus Eremiobacteraeota bacterium]